VWKRRSWALFVHLSRIYRGASPRRLTCTDFPVNDLVVHRLLEAEERLAKREPPADPM
jgi:hypothetical protein